MAKHVFGRAGAHVNDATFAMLEGRFDLVEGHVQRALEVASTESMAISNSANAILLVLRREQGRLDELIDFVRAFLDRFPKILAWRGGLAWGLAELGRDAEARIELERLAADDFAVVPREMLWLVTMSQLADVVVALGDETRARVLYEQLRPWEDACVTCGPVLCLGSAARWVGSLATTIGRFDEAARCLEKALAVDSGMGARPAAAWDRYEQGRLWMRTGRDPALARQHLDAALAAARELGMVALGRRIEALGLSSSPASRRRVSRFVREHEYWTIEHEGETIRLRHTKGLAYLAELLARPNERLPAVAVLAVAGGRPEPGWPDESTRRSLEAVQEEVAEAERLNDIGRVESARARLGALLERIDPTTPGALRAAEKARLGVTKPLKSAIQRVREAHPELGRHLATSIQTGAWCRYAPGTNGPGWEVRAGSSPTSTRRGGGGR